MEMMIPCRCVQKHSPGGLGSGAQTGQQSCCSREAFAGATLGFGPHFKAVFLKKKIYFDQFRFTSPENTSQPSAQNLPQYLVVEDAVLIQSSLEQKLWGETEMLQSRAEEEAQLHAMA